MIACDSGRPYDAPADPSWASLRNHGECRIKARESCLPLNASLIICTTLGGLAAPEALWAGAGADACAEAFGALATLEYDLGAFFVFFDAMFDAQG